MASLPLQHCGWTANDTLRAEASLLEHAFQDSGYYYNKEKGQSAYEVFNVHLSKDESYISTLRIPARNPMHDNDLTDEKMTKPPPLLLLHGFGTGKSTWAPLFKHLAALSKEQNRIVYAIDLPGMGCSSEFNAVHERKVRNIVDEAGERVDREDPEYAKMLSRNAVRYYVDAIHAWIVEMGIGRLVVLGHSFGARIAAAFVHAHPTLVEKLIMISPVGIESHPSSSSSTSQELGSTEGRRSLTISEKIIGYLWTDYHITPLTIVRLVGPLLPYVVGAFVYTSNIYRWARKDKKLCEQAWVYAYAMVRHRSSAETLMPCFITGTGGAVVEESDLLSDILQDAVEVFIIRGGKDWVPVLRRQEELCRLGMRVSVLDKGEHSLQLTESERTWPLVAGTLSS